MGRNYARNFKDRIRPRSEGARALVLTPPFFINQQEALRFFLKGEAVSSTGGFEGVVGAGVSSLTLLPRRSPPTGRGKPQNRAVTCEVPLVGTARRIFKSRQTVSSDRFCSVFFGVASARWGPGFSAGRFPAIGRERHRLFTPTATEWRVFGCGLCAETGLYPSTS